MEAVLSMGYVDMIVDIISIGIIFRENCLK